jgi:hypothetical protein
VRNTGEGIVEHAVVVGEGRMAVYVNGRSHRACDSPERHTLAKQLPSFPCEMVHRFTPSGMGVPKWAIFPTGAAASPCARTREGDTRR